MLELLAGKPVRPGGPPGEAVTPTGAILAELAEVGPLPPFVPRKIAGVGTVAWPDRPNVLADDARRGGGDLLKVLGGAQEGAGEDALWVLEANLDDCPGQLVARAIEAALEAGALDVGGAAHHEEGPAGRALGALCEEPRRAAVSAALFAETTTPSACAATGWSATCSSARSRRSRRPTVRCG